MQASIRSSGGDCQSAIAVPTALDGNHVGTTLAPIQALAPGSGGATSPLVAALAQAVLEQPCLTGPVAIGAEAGWVVPTAIDTVPTAINSPEGG